MRGFATNMPLPTACAIAADMIGKIAREAITVGARTTQMACERRKMRDSRTNAALAICIVQVAVVK